MGRRDGRMVIALDSRVRVMAGNVMLCFWARHSTLDHSASLHRDVYMASGEFNALELGGGVVGDLMLGGI